MKLTTSSIVKKFAALSLAVAGVYGANRVYANDVAPAPVTETVAYQSRSVDDIQQLTGPIALYPDALLSQVLVASTYPNDVVAAAKYLQEGGNPAADCGCGWDASVQGLLQTSDVLNQLAANVDWMNQLGDTFLNQQQDVFSAIQTLRAKARGCGNLVSTQQTRVIVAENAIQIVPADPEIIYVPRYDPRIVFLMPRVELLQPAITFDTGIQVGVWLQSDFDWHDHCVYTGNWGVERPWWRHDGDVEHGGYVQSRPGTYINVVNNETKISNVNNTTINNTNINHVTTWSHNGNSPAPRHIDGPVAHMTPVTPNVNNGRTENHVPRSPMSTAVRSRTADAKTPVQPAIPATRGAVNASVHAAQPALKPKENVLKAPTQLVHTATPSVQPKPSVMKAPTQPAHTAQPTVQPRPNIVKAPTQPVHTAQPTVQPRPNIVKAPTQPVHPAQPTIQPKPSVVKAPTQVVHTAQPTVQPRPTPAMQSHPAQANPVRQPASYPVPTQGPKPVAMATPRANSTPAPHGTPAPATRRGQGQNY